jgi:hypothetical protein
MKQKRFFAGMLAATLAFGLVLVGCATENLENSEDLATGGINVKLPYDVTARQAGAKLDEIIAYSGTPSSVEGQARILKSHWPTWTAAWSSSGTSLIVNINSMIDQIPKADESD